MALSDIIPTNSSDKRKFFAALGVVLACFVWLCFYLLSNSSDRHVAREPNSPAFKMALDLSKQLVSDHEFADVGFSVESEKPLKLAVVGAVYSNKALERLNDRLKELRPEGDYETRVEVLHR